MAYLDEEWNNPGLTEHYLMQLTQKVCQILSTKPNGITIEQFKLPFSRVAKARATQEDKRAQAKARFQARKAQLLAVKAD